MEEKKEKKLTFGKIIKVVGIGLLTIGTAVAIYDRKDQIAGWVNGLKKNPVEPEKQPQQNNNNYNYKQQNKNWK